MKKDLNWSFGRNVHRLRLQAGLTQSELGAKCGIRKAHVSALELGTRGPSLSTIELIAKALKVPAARLLVGVKKVAA